MKILFYASYPTLTIGYSRIANVLTNYLAEQGHDIYYVEFLIFPMRLYLDMFIQTYI